jgi:hypothetical protein
MRDFPSLYEKSNTPTEDGVNRPEVAKTSESPHHNQKSIHPEVIDHLMAVGPLATETADGMTP